MKFQRRIPAVCDSLAMNPGSPSEQHPVSHLPGRYHLSRNCKIETAGLLAPVQQVLQKTV
jgi:hypothetical protein